MDRLSRMIAAVSLAMLVGALSELHADTADMAAGRRIYDEACKACHGLDGTGAGVMKFRPPAADLTVPWCRSSCPPRVGPPSSGDSWHRWP